MRTALLAVTALVALLSPAVARNRIDATTAAAPTARPIDHSGVADPAALKPRLHYDLPCRVSSAGTCITEPPPYPRYRPRP